jgi:hypothetical protein
LYFPRRQPNVEPRLKLKDFQITTGLEWELPVAVGPESLHRLQFVDAADVPTVPYRKSQVQSMLRRIDPPEPNPVFVAAYADGEYPRLRKRPASANVPYELRKQRMYVLRLQPEHDELGMVQRLHEADGIQERRLVIVDGGSVPAVLPHYFGDLLFQTAP